MSKVVDAKALAVLENDIAEVNGAMAVLDIVSRATLQRLSAEPAAMFHIPTGALGSYRMYALTVERSEALDHALLHLEDVIRRLDRAYGELEKAEANDAAWPRFAAERTPSNLEAVAPSDAA